MRCNSFAVPPSVHSPAFIPLMSSQYLLDCVFTFRSCSLKTMITLCFIGSGRASRFIKAYNTKMKKKIERECERTKNKTHESQVKTGGGTGGLKGGKMQVGKEKREERRECGGAKRERKGRGKRGK